MIGAFHVNSLLVIFLQIIIGIAIAAVVGSRTRTLLPCLVSFGLHVVISLGLFYTLGLPAIGPDAGTYHLLAGQVADSLSGVGSGLSYVEGKEGWLYVLGGIYFVVGKIPEAGLLVIATFMAVLPAILATASRLIGWERSAVTTAWFAVFLPSLIIWPSSILREGPSIFILSFIVLAVALYHATRTIIAGVLLLVATLGMMWIRPAMGVAALLGIVIAVVLIPRVRKGGIGPAALFLAPAAIALPLGLIRGSTLDFSTAASLRQNLSFGATTSTGATTEGFDTPTGSIFGILRDLPGASFGPLPWEVLQQPWQLAFDGLTFVALFGLAFFAVRRKTTRREALSLLLPAVAILFFVSAAFGNYGFVVRQRSQAAPFLVPVAAAGWVLYRQGRNGKGLKFTPDERAIARSHV